jgi:ketosteroid isomerase-like protein
MPPSNTEVVRANSQAFSRQDVGAMLALHKPDAVVADRRAVGFGVFPGHDAIRAYYEGLFDNTASIVEDLEIVSDEDDIVIATAHVRVQLVGQPEDLGVVTFEYALRVETEDGLIAKLDIYDDSAAAAAAAGD